MLPLKTRQFSSTFLDFWRNSRGYEEEVRTADRDVMKALLNPLVSNNDNVSCKCGVARNHPLGNMMVEFARQWSTVHSQKNTQRVRNIDAAAYSDNGDEKDRNYDEDDECVNTFNKDFRKDVPSQNSMTLIDKVSVDDYQSSDTTSEESVLHAELCKNNVTSENNNGYLFGSSFSNDKYLNELFCEESCIKPLPCYKHVNRSKLTVSSCLTLCINESVLKSVLQSGERVSRNQDVNVCGRIAILHGFMKEGATSISVTGVEVIGMYDYIEGKLQPFSQRCYLNDVKDIKEPLPSSFGLGVNLGEFLEQWKVSSFETAGRREIECSPVAWLLTSPALGVLLDWQVRKEVFNYLESVSSKSNATKQVSSALHSDGYSREWCNILVVVDEYRCVETGIPLVEAYQFFANGTVNLVNFDIN